MNLSELSQKIEDHLTDQDIQDAQELLDDTYQQIVDMRGELVESQAEIARLRTQAVADAARIAELERALDSLSNSYATCGNPDCTPTQICELFFDGCRS
jgi:hypothetical protein